MRARNFGELVLFASLAGWLPTPAMAAYAATKFAVVGFAETLAMELQGSGVAVRCVCPAAVQTPMLDDIMSQGVLPDRFMRMSGAAPAALVIAAVEASLRRTSSIFVFPVLRRRRFGGCADCRRGALGTVIRRLSAAT